MRPRVVTAVGLAACSSLVMGGLLANFSVVTVVLAAVAAVAPAALVAPALYFYVFLMARPIVDVWKSSDVGSFNAASIMTFLLIAVCAADFVLKPAARRAVVENRFLRVFNLWFGLFLCVSLGSFLTTPAPSISFADWLRMLSVQAAVNEAVILMTQSPRHRQWLLWGVLGSSIVPVMAGLVQWATGSGLHLKGFNRIYGTFTHCNVFAEYLLLITFLCIVFLNDPKTRVFIRCALGGYLLVVLFSLLHTYTRTVWVALAVSLLLYAVLRPTWLTKGLTLALLVAFGLYLIPHVRDRFEMRHEYNSSMNWRMNLWEDTVHDLSQHPWVGHGLGSYELEVGVMAHNDMLRIAYEAGLPAAALFLGMCLWMEWHLWGRRRSRTVDGVDPQYAHIGLCVMTGLLVSSLAVNTLRSTVIMLLYFCVVAVMIQHEEPVLVS